MIAGLGRDKLGRIIYEHDVVEDYGLLYNVFGDDGFYGFLIIFGNNSRLWHVSAHSVTVDLNNSPRRTNHERYFAGFGSVDDVLAIKENICIDIGMHCLDCPFTWWGSNFSVKDDPSCGGFGLWLKQEAVM